MMGLGLIHLEGPATDYPVHARRRAVSLSPTLCEGKESDQGGEDDARVQWLVRFGLVFVMVVSLHNDFLWCCPASHCLTFMLDCI